MKVIAHCFCLHVLIFRKYCILGSRSSNLFNTLHFKISYSRLAVLDLKLRNSRHFTMLFLCQGPFSVQTTLFLPWLVASHASLFCFFFHVLPTFSLTSRSRRASLDFCFIPLALSLLAATSVFAASSRQLDLSIPSASFLTWFLDLLSFPFSRGFLTLCLVQNKAKEAEVAGLAAKPDLSLKGLFMPLSH